MPISKTTIKGFHHRLRGNSRHVRSPYQLKPDYKVGWYVAQEMYLPAYEDGLRLLDRKVKSNLLINMAVIAVAVFFLPYAATTRLIVLGAAFVLAFNMARLYVSIMKWVLILTLSKKFAEANGGLK